MPLVKCDEILPGFRDSECVVQIVDNAGKKHYIRVEKDFLTELNKVKYLSVGFIGFRDRKQFESLIQFPHEPETGDNRIWVNSDQLNFEYDGAFA